MALSARAGAFRLQTIDVELYPIPGFAIRAIFTDRQTGEILFSGFLDDGALDAIIEAKRQPDTADTVLEKVVA